MADARPNLTRSAMLAGAGLVALAACSRPPPVEGPAPVSLAKADPMITGLQPTEKGVRVIARLPAPDLAGDSIGAASRALRQLARAVQAGAPDLPPGAAVLTFDLYGVDVDKFGKRTPGRFFQSDFDLADLRRINLKSMGPAAVLNTAIDLRIDRAGEGPIAAWCMRYPHVGWNYCSMAGNGS